MKFLVVLSILTAYQVRANTNKCYPVTEPLQVTVLPPTCPVNEEYSVCGANGCQATCANPDLPMVCKAMCVAGCICKSGYIRNDNGDCVKPRDCRTKKCPVNEEFQDCGTACPLTCSNYQNPPIFCIDMCVIGCFCNEGFVRDENGRCVKPSECPVPECPAHEEWSDCGAYCQRTCGPPTPCAAPPQDCNPGCICESGHIRSQHGGECIPVDRCPQDCPANEVWSQCDAQCQHKCENKGSPLKCPKICAPGCVCEKGFVRNSKGICVKVEECPEKCPRDEVYSECDANSCQMFCRWYYNPEKYACRPTCTAGCVCVEGLIRNSRGICLKPERCTKQERIW